MADLSKQLEQRAQTVNMNAGPSPLPQDALLTAAKSLLSFDGSPGMGIAEISHRSKPFAKVFDQANADLRKLLDVPDNYKILWMQGGGLTQFAATVLNLVAWYRTKHQLNPQDRVEGWYAVTGSWSKKAADEAARLGVDVRKVVDGKKAGAGKFRSIPPANEWDWPQFEEDQRKPAFIYYCDNETVDGIEFAGSNDSEASFPFSQVDPAIPIVCDMSSNFLSRPVDVSKYGIIYAGAQKNLGPAGVTLVIVRDDLLVNADEAVQYGSAPMPSMLSYKVMADDNSLFNTPPTFAIYVCALVLRSLLTSPPTPNSSSSSDSTAAAAAAVAPLSPLSAFADQKSSLLYTAIDESAGFYQGTADKSVRSRMNVTFRIKGGDEELEKLFIKEAGELGIMGVNGHRSVGGLRASIYNAVSLEGVQKLADLMHTFRAKYSS